MPLKCYTRKPWEMLWYFSCDNWTPWYYSYNSDEGCWTLPLIFCITDLFGNLSGMVDEVSLRKTIWWVGLKVASIQYKLYTTGAQLLDSTLDTSTQLRVLCDVNSTLCLTRQLTVISRQTVSQASKLGDISTRLTNL